MSRVPKHPKTHRQGYYRRRRRAVRILLTVIALSMALLFLTPIAALRRTASTGSAAHALRRRAACTGCAALSLGRTTCTGCAALSLGRTTCTGATCTACTGSGTAGAAADAHELVIRIHAGVADIHGATHIRANLFMEI